MNRKHYPVIKRYCVHEAGHAIVCFHLGILITGVQLKLSFDGDLMKSEGDVGFDSKRLNEDLKSEDYSVRSLAFMQDLAHTWAGIVAIQEVYKTKKVFDECKHDQDTIQERVKDVEEQQKGEGKRLEQRAYEQAKEIIQENRGAMERLADKLNNLLLANHYSIKLDGQEVIRIICDQKGVN
jgi:hypothetical protein